MNFQFSTSNLTSSGSKFFVDVRTMPKFIPRILSHATAHRIAKRIFKIMDMSPRTYSFYFILLIHKIVKKSNTFCVYYTWLDKSSKKGVFEPSFECSRKIVCYKSSAHIKLYLKLFSSFLARSWAYYHVFVHDKLI